MVERRRVLAYLPPFPPTSGGGGDPAVGGDLSGSASAAQVVGIRGVPIDGTTPESGQSLVYDLASGTYKNAYLARYFSTGAAAQAGAPHVVGTFVIVYPGATPDEAGTYEITTNDGASFPSDYTKVSDHTDTAGEVGVIDADGNFTASDVETALAELANGQVLGKTGTLSITNNVIDFVTASAYASAQFLVTLINGTQRYQTTVLVVHDDTTADVTETNVQPGPGVSIVPVTFSADIASGDLRLIATATDTGWSYRVRRLALQST